MADAPTDIYEMIALVAFGLKGVETQWDTPKLEKKLKEYFNKAGRNIVFKGKKLNVAINEYVDNAMSSVFAGLGDRDWINTEVGDMTLILDAGIKAIFPGSLFRDVTQDDFEAMVLEAYDKAFDEQRFWPILSEAVSANVTGPKIKKKVWNAIDAARKETAKLNLGTAEEFVSKWCTSSVNTLATSHGGLEGIMDAETCVTLFSTILETGGLPSSVASPEEVPPIHAVEEAVANSYLLHAPAEAEPDLEAELADEGGEIAPPAAKRARGAVFDAFG